MARIRVKFKVKSIHFVLVRAGIFVVASINVKNKYASDKWMSDEIEGRLTGYAWEVRRP
jgi:hypothetical protein